MPPASTPPHSTPPVQGSIDLLEGDVVHGWLVAGTEPVEPILFADDQPCRCLCARTPRPDVAEALGCAPEVGFAFQLAHLKATSVLTLYAALPLSLTPVCSRPARLPVWENRFFAQLDRAARLAQEPDAVAITCWDGAHNPVGRASVLYDCVALHRPVVLFCYVEQGFGSSLWPPLRNSDRAIVTVPWAYRRQFRSVARDYGLAFKTVWICKPRLPSFLLAADLAHTSTHFLCDMDDDEEAFSQAQPTSSTAYDTPGLGLASLLRDSVTARTVVSPTLRQRYGGLLLRHARDPHAFAPRPATAKDKPKASAPPKIAFIGTVREHKNLLAAAQALQNIRATLPVEFHILGDVAPEALRHELEATGAILVDTVPLPELPATLAGMDAVLTGFPPDKNADALAKAVTTAQVPAKISDALAAGLPVLTPNTKAIADLRHIPGVYPFTRKTFARQLQRALNQSDPIALPTDFTLEGAYTAFAAAEAQAQPVPSLSALLPALPEKGNTATTPALLLLWKQLDAGIYGRRVDQIARSYHRHFPDHRVIVLEMEQSTSQKASGTAPWENFCDESPLREETLRRKRHGWVQDGITYRTLSFADADQLRDRCTRFFLEGHLTPRNTVLVLFPIQPHWQAVSDIFAPFPQVVDVVDNQISWATAEDQRCRVLEQYYSLLAHAPSVVFNAEANKHFFTISQIRNAEATAPCIPNWYTLPDGFVYRRRPLQDNLVHLWYSGNMNDRLDWELLHRLAQLPRLRLHLAGTASRRSDELDALLAYRSVIYHGVTSERETLALLQSMDAAIVPHLVDRVSRYMDPLKIRMYAAVGLPTLCPPHLGMGVDTVIHYRSREHCVQLVGSLADQSKDTTGTGHVPTAVDSNESAYLDLLTNVRQAAAGASS